MKRWEREAKKRAYTGQFKGRVLSELDALQVARLAETEGWNDALDTLQAKVESSVIYRLEPTDYHKKLLKVLKELRRDGTTTDTHHT